MEENNMIVDWNIENISYWRLELHEKCISSSALSLYSEHTLEVELYPRGLSGNDDYMMVKIIEADFDSSGEGDLSFIGSDGSIICTQPLDYDEGTELQGPKFIDVFAQTKKNDKSYKDQITLRFQFHLADEDFEHLVKSTIIDVREVSLTIDQELVKICNPSSELIFRDEEVSLQTVLDGETVKFMLEPDEEINHAFLVETYISMVSSDNMLVRKEEKRHVFSKEKKTLWTFSDSLETKVVSEKEITVILRLVIIQHDVIEKSSSKFYNDVKISTVANEQELSRILVSSTEDSVATLTKDFMCLYQDQGFSDFQLKCGTATFPVHRNILSARSPVFKTMLSCDMKETASGCMDIVDLDVPTLTRFLEFLYTGAIEGLQGERALKLYYAADKYQVPSLKKVCSNHLCANISLSNVCDILPLADRHQDQDLITVSHKFVLNNYNKILKSKEWESFIEGESLLAAKIMTFFAANDCVAKKKSLE